MSNSWRELCGLSGTLLGEKGEFGEIAPGEDIHRAHQNITSGFRWLIDGRPATPLEVRQIEKAALGFYGPGVAATFPDSVREELAARREISNVQSTIEDISGP
jgi:hypothetical protein